MLTFCRPMLREALSLISGENRKKLFLSFRLRSEQLSGEQPDDIRQPAEFIPIPTTTTATC
jgi:hypothetical protein